MAPNPRRAPRHEQREWRSIGTAGNDDWQRQADAAAWSAVSGMHPSLYLGGIEPIPIPPDLRAQLREAGKAMAGDPSAARADALLRLAHRAVYGAEPPETLFPTDPAPAGAVSTGDWWETPAEPEKPSGAALEAFALESFAALQATGPDPEGAGEAPDQQHGDWWE